ncbi:MAG: D-alanyl-D-alanine carboxypeptidase [Cyclobacteriaceae bacterium]|nr:D-alanyl-D-alanine carboxypeptidase [Cyclobacteriaceae bacterium]
MKKIFLFSLILLPIVAFPQKRKIKKMLINLEQTHQNHTGFMLYDPGTNATLMEYNSAKYFTPASNTKIFTLYASLNVLGDSIPSMYYVERGDSLIFWGSGDPGWLYSRIEGGTVPEILKNTNKNLYFSSSNFNESHFGPNWAWDDYNYYYSVERTPLPLYGNYFVVSKDSGQAKLKIDQPAFKKFFWMGDSLVNTPVVRSYGSNSVQYFPQDINASFSREVPFSYSDLLITRLLSDTLKKKVRLIEAPLPEKYHTTYTHNAANMYQVMMQISDNFIAEQLLLLCAGKLSDTLNTSSAINYSKKFLLADLPDEPIWVDGSGLSRYNLFTPRSVVRLWEKLLDENGREKLFPLLATGGQAGTIKGWYKSDKPFIYGKTGTLRNNHSLSGYLITDKGRLLIFSFMNNNYKGSSGEVKVNMEQVLQFVKENY